MHHCRHGTTTTTTRLDANSRPGVMPPGAAPPPPGFKATAGRKRGSQGIED